MDPSLNPRGALSGAATIAGALASDGAYVVKIDPGPPQRLVDVYWAAHSAGRLLGTKVAVKVDGPEPGIDPLVTITVTPRPAPHSAGTR